MGKGREITERHYHYFLGNLPHRGSAANRDGGKRQRGTVGFTIYQIHLVRNRGLFITYCHEFLWSFFLHVCMCLSYLGLVPYLTLELWVASKSAHNQ